LAGAPFSGPVATFRVRDPFADAHDFRAFVKWGDGTKSWATIEQEPSGGFVVDATHTYSDPGTFYTTVFIVRLWRGFAVVHGAATVLQAAPAVTGISPVSGPESGGTTVTITGTDLTGATDVQFGDTSAINFTVDGPTQITATAPGGTGTADITVTTPGGTSTTSDADQYGYIPAPGVTGIGPTFGPEAGGTTVTITGTDFSGATDVEFGSTAASAFNVDSPTQITAVAPAGSGIRDVTVTTPSGTSAVSRADLYTYIPAPAVTGISPTSGPESGGTTVTITGTDFSAATDVEFGNAPAASFHLDGSTQITASAPAGTGTVDITVTTPSGTSTTSNADQFTYIAARVVQQTGSPTVATGPPTVQSSGAGLAGSVNPQGLTTTAHFEYGLDARYTKPGTSGPVYDHSTTDEPVGTDFSVHSVLASVAGLSPNALYHARLVAANADGTTFGPDVVFKTPADPAPAPPTLGTSFNVAPVSGLVTVKLHGSFVPLTQVRSIPAGSIINTLQGSLKLITATGKKHKNQHGTFGGAVFKVTQFGSGKNKGLTTLALVEGGVKGGPSYAACNTKSTKQASIAALSKKTLQLLHGSDNHAKFRTKGRYSAATIRGTVWTIADRCDGTIVHVTRGLVDVTDFVRHITVVVRAGHTYLALAKPKKHR
jgi:IPT/TIG domain